MLGGHELVANNSRWTAFGTVAPAYVLLHDEVPIVSVYKRP